jgi:hypothetical protein
MAGGDLLFLSHGRLGAVSTGALNLSAGRRFSRVRPHVSADLDGNAN